MDERIRRNVQKMRAAGASIAEIEAYLRGEGLRPKEETPPADFSRVESGASSTAPAPDGPLKRGMKAVAGAARAVYESVDPEFQHQFTRGPTSDQREALRQAEGAAMLRPSYGEGRQARVLGPYRDPDAPEIAREAPPKADPSVTREYLTPESIERTRSILAQIHNGTEATNPATGEPYTTAERLQARDFLINLDAYVEREASKGGTGKRALDYALLGFLNKRAYRDQREAQIADILPTDTDLEDLGAPELAKGEAVTTLQPRFSDVARDEMLPAALGMLPWLGGASVVRAGATVAGRAAPSSRVLQALRSVQGPEQAAMLRAARSIEGAPVLADTRAIALVDAPNPLANALRAAATDAKAATAGPQIGARAQVRAARGALQGAGVGAVQDVSTTLNRGEDAETALAVGTLGILLGVPAGAALEVAVGAGIDVVRFGKIARKLSTRIGPANVAEIARKHAGNPKEFLREAAALDRSINRPGEPVPDWMRSAARTGARVVEEPVVEAAPAPSGEAGSASTAAIRGMAIGGAAGAVFGGDQDDPNVALGMVGAGMVGGGALGMAARRSLEPRPEDIRYRSIAQYRPETIRLMDEFVREGEPPLVDDITDATGRAYPHLQDEINLPQLFREADRFERVNDARESVGLPPIPKTDGPVWQVEAASPDLAADALIDVSAGRTMRGDRPKARLPRLDDVGTTLGVAGAAGALSDDDERNDGFAAAAALAGRPGKVGSYGLGGRLADAIGKVKFEKNTGAAWLKAIRSQGRLNEELAYGLQEVFSADPQKRWTRAELLKLVETQGIRLHEENFGATFTTEVDKARKAIVEAYRPVLRQEYRDFLTSDIPAPKDGGPIPPTLDERIELIEEAALAGTLDDLNLPPEIAPLAEHLDAAYSRMRPVARARLRQTIEERLSARLRAATNRVNRLISEEGLLRYPERTPSPELLRETVLQSEYGKRLDRFQRDYHERNRARQAASGDDDAPVEGQPPATTGKARWATYRVAGGRNYRETVVSLHDDVFKAHQPPNPVERPKLADHFHVMFDDDGSGSAVPTNVFELQARRFGVEGNRHRVNIERGLDGATVETYDRLLGRWRPATEGEMGMPREDFVREALRLHKWTDAGARAAESALPPYESPHWDGINNPILHVRMDDRILPSGERVLFADEIQSDLHQTARKNGGYADGEARAQAIADARRRVRVLHTKDFPGRYGENVEGWVVAQDHTPLWLYMSQHEAEDALPMWREHFVREFLDEALPDLPYKETADWTKLAVKRLFDEAVAGDYDYLAFTTGPQINEALGLHNHYSKIVYYPDQRRLQAWKADFDSPDALDVFLHDIDEARTNERDILAEHIGERLTDRLLAAPRTSRLDDGDTGHLLEGDDLRVEHGNDAYYGALVPNVAKAALREIGINAEVVHFSSRDLGIPDVPRGLAEPQPDLNPAIRLTPEIREAVKSGAFTLGALAGLTALNESDLLQSDENAGMTAAALGLVPAVRVRGSLGKVKLRGWKVFTGTMHPLAEHEAIDALKLPDTFANLEIDGRVRRFPSTRAQAAQLRAARGSLVIEEGFTDPKTGKWYDRLEALKLAREKNLISQNPKRRENQKRRKGGLASENLANRFGPEGLAPEQVGGLDPTFDEPLDPFGELKRGLQKKLGGGQALGVAAATGAAASDDEDSPYLAAMAATLGLPGGKKLSEATVDDVILGMRQMGKTAEAARLEKFMEGSVVREVVFHGTTYDFDAFRQTNDLGYHFGTAQHANTRLGMHEDGTSIHMHITGQNDVRPHEQAILPVVIRLQNPVKIIEPIHGDWNGYLLGMQLKAIGAITPEQFRELMVSGQSGSRWWGSRIRQLLQKNGYDGIVYENLYEDPLGKQRRVAYHKLRGNMGDPFDQPKPDWWPDDPMKSPPRGKDSYIVFDSRAIKSITGNRGTFSRATGDVRGSAPLAAVTAIGGGASGSLVGAVLAEAAAGEEYRGVGAVGGAIVGARVGALLPSALARIGARPGYLAQPSVKTSFAGAPAVLKTDPALVSGAGEMYTEIIKELHPLNEFGRRVDRSERLTHEAARARGWRGLAEDLIGLHDRNVFDRLGIRRTRTPHPVTLRDVLRAAEGHEADVIELLRSERAIELNAKGYADKGFDIAQAQANVATLAAIPEVRAAADKYREFYSRLLDLKVAHGVLTQDAANAIRANHEMYVSFLRDFGETENPRSMRSAGSPLQKGKATRKMNPEEIAASPLLDPFYVAVMDAEQTAQAISKQRVTNLLAEIVATHPKEAHPYIEILGTQPQQVPVEARARGEVFEANVQGKRTYFRVKDPDLLAAMSATTPRAINTFRDMADRLWGRARDEIKQKRVGGAAVSALGAAASKMVSGAKTALQTGVTITPAFGAANFARDQAFTVLATTFRQGRPLVGAAAGAAGGAVFGDDETSDLLRGGAFGLAAGIYAPHLGRTLAAAGHILGQSDLYRQYLREGGGSTGFFLRDEADAKRLFQRLQKDGYDMGDILRPASWLEALEMVNRGIEQATRFSRWNSLRKQGVPEAERVFGSQDVSVDFQSRGKNPIVRTAADMKAFWNPNLQSKDKLVRTLKNPRAWAMGLAAITAPTMALWSINKDDEGYWQQPLWVRNLFWLVPDGTHEDGTTRFLKIPKPFEVGYIFGSLFERGADFMYQRDPERFAAAAQQMTEQSVDGLLPIPTLAQPAIENMIGEGGYSFFTGREIENKALQKLSPPERIDAKTSFPAIALARGIDAATMGLWQPSPKKTDHTLRNLTGTMGGLTLDAITSAAVKHGIDKRPPLPARPRGQWARFHTEPGFSTDDIEVMMARFKAGEQKHADYEALLDSGSDDQLAAFEDRHQQELDDYEALQGAVADYIDILAEKREVESDRTLSPEEKRTRLLALMQEAAEIARDAVERKYVPAQRPQPVAAE